MRKTVPFGSTVATGRAPPSSAPELSAGNAPVDQTTQLSWLGRREVTFRQISSMAMTARPVSSCPVTTRLMLSMRSSRMRPLAGAPPAAPHCRPAPVTFVIYTIKIVATSSRGTPPMKRSTDRILTTHVGSLPRPADLLAGVQAKEQGKPVVVKEHAARLSGAAAAIVRKQVELGIDVVDDGEYGKPSFVSYVNERLGGFEVDREVPRQSPWAGSREARAFPEFYGEGHVAARQNHMVCTAPITYRGRAQLQVDIDNLKAALAGAAPQEAFMPAISPTSAADWQRNAYYKTEEEYLFAIAD